MHKNNLKKFLKLHENYFYTKDYFCKRAKNWIKNKIKQKVELKWKKEEINNIYLMFRGSMDSKGKI